MLAVATITGARRASGETYSRARWHQAKTDLAADRALGYTRFIDPGCANANENLLELDVAGRYYITFNLGSVLRSTKLKAEVECIVHFPVAANGPTQRPRIEWRPSCTSPRVMSVTAGTLLIAAIS